MQYVGGEDGNVEVRIIDVDMKSPYRTLDSESMKLYPTSAGRLVTEVQQWGPYLFRPVDTSPA